MLDNPQGHRRAPRCRGEPLRLLISRPCRKELIACTMAAAE